MIVTTPNDFLAAYSPERFPATSPATARAVFLVAPAGFSLAAESATDNRYMAMQERTDATRALVEHAELASRLRSSVPTIVFPGDPKTPDAVFPNNVFATASGKFIVGAMRHAVRKREADRADIRAFFSDVLHYETIDLSGNGFAAELTGSLVIDHARGIGFCGLSDRCDMAGARAMHEAFDLKLMFCFELASGEYHTNVVLAILASRAAIIAPDGFADTTAADAIAKIYAPQALCLHSSQRAAFAGNAIAVSPDAVWISARAAASLAPSETAALQAWGFEVRSVELGEIEKAGGSLRCCVAEIF